MGVVAAGAYDLEKLHAGIYLGGVVPHGSSAACDLVGRLRLSALSGECRQKGCVLGGRGLAAHDLVHHGVGFVIGQVLFADDLHDCFLDHFLNPP